MATKVVVNSAGVKALLQSDEVKADLERRAKNIAAVAGEGFEVDSEVGANRARASVRTVTFAARHAEATDRVLTRALDAGRQ